MQSNPMDRRFFLRATASLTALATVPVLFCQSKNHNKPNVLLILTDDQGWGDVTSHGNSHLNISSFFLLFIVWYLLNYTYRIC